MTADSDRKLFDFENLAMGALTSIPDSVVYAVAEKFYGQWIQGHSEIAAVFAREKSDLKDLKERQVGYWKTLFRDFASDKFLEHARKIGTIHQQREVLPVYYIAAYAFFVRELVDLMISRAGMFPSRARPVLKALISVVFYDISTVLQSYIADDVVAKNMEQKEEMLLGFSKDAVQVSIALNDMFISIIRSRRQAEEVEQNAQSISAAVEELVASVQQISSNSSQASELSLKAVDEATRGVQTVEQAVMTVNKIDQAVTGTTQAVVALVDSANQIEGFVATIEAIANQTNLLALNATIEAARAGEAGKGFAIVASEVKQLSDQTTKASKEIKSRISALLQETHNISDDMKNVQVSVAEGIEVMNSAKDLMTDINDGSHLVSQRMQDVSAILQEQALAANEVSRAVGHIRSVAAQNMEISKVNEEAARNASRLVETQLSQLASQSQSGDLAVSLAQSDHVIWKRKLADLLIGQSALDPSELKDHHVCRLGKWYYGVGKERYGDLPAYRELEGPHQAVHSHGLKAARLHDEGKMDEALEEYIQMEAASKIVLSNLAVLQEAILSQKTKRKN